MANVTIIDNSAQVLEEFGSAVERALEECGMRGETHAKENAHVISGDLRNSISHKVVAGEKYVAIGTNLYYAPYEELGTGKYATVGGGRPTPWAYQDGQGKWHYTHGNHAHPFIKPAVADHGTEYREVIKKHLKDG